MCTFISESNVMPGWACCRCRTYNGLQRTACKACREPRHELALPANLLQCSCGFGAFERGPAWSRTADGRDIAGRCPVCGEPWPPRASEEARL
jgi:hypothetical protein